ncbi:MAG TPA: sigma-54 dependent transcriptional regulator [Rhodocyclaceae bacterium]|nr:sigma-54 dependent transcriptional regulator [Rhodocyclaceae bacterium]
MTKKMLVVENDVRFADQLSEFFRLQGWEVSVCTSVAEALRLIAAKAPQVVVAERSLPDQSGLELAARLGELAPAAKLIVMAADCSARTAVDALRAGAHDYIAKPFALAELQRIVDTAAASENRAAAPPLREKKATTGSGLDALIGTSPAMQELKSSIQQLLLAGQRMTDGDFPAVLIQGETGTGKELVARALHVNSASRCGEFVEINCASIPSHLLEAELFGHHKGAFTDAKASRVGLVEAADGGTLFLDEIGEIDLSIQAKLLKLLEDKTIRPLGSVTEKKINLRIVSATNRDLEQMVREGRFRSDLYFRLRIIALKVPALRQRGSDALLLARHFLALHGQRYGKPGLRFSADAEHALSQHSWPGNVRELRNLLEQIVVMAAGDVISAEQLRLRPALAPAVESEFGAEPLPSQDLLERYLLTRPARGVEVEAERVVEALTRTGWNVTKAARVLGLSRDMLRYRIERMNLERPAAPPAGEFVYLA